MKSCCARFRSSSGPPVRVVNIDREPNPLLLRVRVPDSPGRKVVTLKFAVKGLDVERSYLRKWLLPQR
jgi:hypothetical protein